MSRAENAKSALIWIACFLMVVGAAYTLTGMAEGGQGWLFGIILLVISIVIFSSVKHKKDVKTSQH